MCPSFDPELPWAETSELPFRKNTSPPSFIQLSKVLMVKFILCSGKTLLIRGKKSVNLKGKKDRGLLFQALYSIESRNPPSFSR